MAWIQSHHLHLWWKFKLWAGKFAWGVRSKHYWVLSTKFWKQKVCWNHPAMFCPNTSNKLSANNLNIHWRWWDRIKTILLNLFCFTYLAIVPRFSIISCLDIPTPVSAIVIVRLILSKSILISKSRSGFCNVLAFVAWK